jgi:hypothetical protein
MSHLLLKWRLAQHIPCLAASQVCRPRKKAADEDRTLVWRDESGFSLLPACVRTYAPQGQTPILRVRLTRDQLSAISAVTPAGQLYLHLQDQAITSPDVVRFLQHLLRQIPGNLLVLWDGAHSSWPAGQGLPRQWGGPAPAPGALAG